MSPYAPPGYGLLRGVVARYGSDRVRRWLAQGDITALALDRASGRWFDISVEYWRSDAAGATLTDGLFKTFVVIVREFDRPPDFVPQWPDQREGFPSPSAEPVTPEPEQNEPAVPPFEGGRPAAAGSTLMDPIWSELIEPHFDLEVARNGPFLSLGTARDAVIELLQAKRKAVLHDRTIERHINKYRPGWVKRGGA